MPDHPAIAPPPADLIRQITSTFVSVIDQNAWSFTVGNDIFSVSEVSAADGLLPMLLYRVQAEMVSSGRDLHAWDRMAYELHHKTALCGVLPVPGNPTYSAKDWVGLIVRWLEGEGAATGRVQSLNGPCKEWGRRLKARRGPFIDKTQSAPPPESQDGVVRLALEAGLMNAARFLIDQGADVDEADDDGFTALHLVAQRGDTAAVRLLLNHGARVDALTRTCQTPATLAAAGDHLETFKALVMAGANLTALDVGDVAGPQVLAFLEGEQA